MVGHKDVVLALLGASAGFAGLVLVFLGLVVTSYQSYGGDTTAGVRSKYRVSAVVVLVAFAVNLVGVALATSWLVLLRDHEMLYTVTIAAFGTQLVSLAAATGWVIRRLMWA